MSHQKNHNTDRVPATYGSWQSAITSELIVSDSISIDEPRITAAAIFYIERRPAENGRCVIVKATKNHSVDILPAPYSARSRVHEYGGGCYCIDENGADPRVFFINDSDQDIYSIKNEQLNRITREENKRFSDFSYDQKFNRLIAICESHDRDTVSNTIVGIDVTSGEITTLEQGNDFYASPRLNPSATRLCWQSWDHPAMPWDGNRLWLADIDPDGQLASKVTVAGGDEVSVFQPQWSPGGTLYFIADDTGWWHLYRYQHAEQSATVEQLSHGEKEFGLPQWVFAQSTYAFINDEQIICCYREQGETELALLQPGEPDASRVEVCKLPTPWQEFSAICATGNRIGFIASSDQQFPQLVSASVSDGKLLTDIIKTACSLPVATGYFSKVRGIRFKNRHRQTVYANYYPPTNPDYPHTDTGTPPLIVICHGGPTGQSSKALDPRKQFWTSRGFALLDVNYSGSTGYGRQYRLRLDGNWGLLDVEDCCDAALHAVAQGLANREQLIIRGSSAGGFTVLAALTFEQVFSAGASYYGISDLTTLATDTHKFEARYLDRLIGPYPEKKTVYEQRSPINSSDRFNCPVIFFQGMEDRVVPREQAEKMVAALEKKGLPVAAQYYAGEQHGFRKAETIVQSLENELAFYQLVFGLKEKDEICFNGDIEIKNI